MDMIPPARTKKSRALEIAALVIGTLTLVVSIYFSTRAEQKKELSVRYLARVPLVASEARRAGELTVSYHNVIARDPYFLSAQVANTGNVPIERRDIDTPLSLTFARGKVLRAEITTRVPGGIDADITQSGNVLILRHGLLNPGDSISFNVIFDGLPTYPSASVRISGISRPTMQLPSADHPSYAATYPATGTRMTYLIVAADSLLAIAAIVLGVGLVGSEVSPLLRSHAMSKLAFESEDLSTVASELPAPLSLLAGSLKGLSLATLDELPVLQAAITQKVASGTLATLDLTPEAAAQQLASAVRSKLPRYLARKAYLRLPSGIDEIARDRILEANVVEGNTEEMLGRLRQIVDDISVIANLGWSQVGVGVLFVTVGLAAALVAAGCWYNLVAVS
jgi:hypothetical protein